MTLFELVLASSLLTTLILFVFSFLFLANTSYQRVEGHYLASEKQFVLWQFFRNLVDGYRPETLKVEQETKHSFSGDAEALTLLVKGSVVGFSSAKQVHIKFNKNTNSLVLKNCLTTTCPSPPDFQEETNIINKLESIKFSYGDYSSPGLLNWTESWQAGKAPALLKIIYQSQTGEAGEFIYHIRSHGTTRCNYSIVERGCLYE